MKDLEEICTFLVSEGLNAEDIKKMKFQDVLSLVGSKFKITNDSIVKEEKILKNKDLRKEIIETAKSCIGVPYVWGGISICGFDCSGLMQYVYEKNNIQIPRITYEQIKIGISVNKENLQPCDLIFFGTFDDPYHIAMYIGDNQIIEAPHTGDNVRVSTLDDRKDFLCVRRIIDDDGKVIIKPQKDNKQFIGEPKYVLYNYVVNMDSDNITFRCGNYSYDKISKMNGYNGTDFCGNLNLNGENIYVANIYKMPKKQLIISKNYKEEDEIDLTIYNDDIVLEFA